MDWTEWKIECHSQVYTNNYNEHVAVTEVHIKCYEEKKENKKNPVPNICRHFHKGDNVSFILKQEYEFFK